MYLVIGATGKQGGAVVEHLKGQPIRALVRNPQSDKARALQQQGVELAVGDLTSSEDINAALEGVQGAFLVTTMLENGVKDEIIQGKAFVDAAKKRNLKHLVFTSVEGADRNTGIPHFDSKWQVEEMIREAGIPNTIVRPVAFMDNFPRVANTFSSKLARFFTIGLFNAALQGKRVQLISVYDIGYVAAQALKKPGQYVGQVIKLAADDLNASEIQDAYHKAQGGRRPWKAFLPKLFLWILPHDLRVMFNWFRSHGYQANINALRSDYPDLLTFENWLKKAN